MTTRTPVVRALRRDEWRNYRELRLRALSDSPDAFGSTWKAEAARPDSAWSERLESGVDSRGDQPLVAELDGVSVGLAWGRADESDPEVAHLYQMWVAPEARGIGAGQLLVDEVIAWARSAGFARLQLAVIRGNLPAERLYERSGFRPIGELIAVRPGSQLLEQEMQRGLQPELLRRFAEDLYVCECELRFYGFRLQTRMAVIVLPGDRLLIYSPIWWTPELGRALGRLGTVEWVISPNKIHNQTLGGFAHAYPAAKLFAPPGLAGRRPDLDFHATLDEGVPPDWGSSVEFALTRGNHFLSEAVLFHRASRSLLVGDLVENFERTTTSALGRLMLPLVGVGNEPVGSPEFRFYTDDAEAAAAAFARISSWDFDRIFLCHGAPITRDAKQALRSVTDGVLRSARGRTAAGRLLLRQIARLQ